MPNRTEFIGVAVSEEEKDFLKKQAEKHDINISELIRRRAIRPEITNSEVADLLMRHMDKRINTVIELLKREPLRKPITKPLKLTPKPSKPALIKPTESPRMFMRDVIDELKGKLDEIKTRYEVED